MSVIEQSMMINQPIEEAFAKLAEPVFARFARRELEASCGHLKDLLEAG